jgi:hypothetical protein
VKRSEHGEQTAVIQWALTLEGRYPALHWLYACPNGEYRSPSVANRLQEEGVKPGVPDLFLPVPLGEYHGLYIEMKRRGGRTSPEQEEWITHLLSVGYRVEVCVGYEQAAAVLCDYVGIPEELIAK